MSTQQEERMAHWERSLINVVEQEVEHLRELDADQSGDIEPGDVHGVLSRVGALTDLAYVEALKLSQEAREELARLDHEALAIMRERVSRSKPGGLQDGGDHELEAARSLYQALLFNLPALATGDASGSAITLSRQAFAELKRHCGDYPSFEQVERLVRVQDYRAMKLAGDQR